MHLALLKGVMTHFLSSSGCWSHGGHTLSSLVSCMPLYCNLSNKGKRWQNLEKNCNASTSWEEYNACSYTSSLVLQYEDTKKW